MKILKKYNKEDGATNYVCYSCDVKEFCDDCSIIDEINKQEATNDNRKDSD